MEFKKKETSTYTVTGASCAILTNQKPMMNMYEGRRAVELICGIYESAKTGKPYVFDKK